MFLCVQQTEAPILIKPFVKDITQSELFAVMTGGFASIAGALLWAFAAYGVRLWLLKTESQLIKKMCLFTTAASIATATTTTTTAAAAVAAVATVAYSLICHFSTGALTIAIHEKTRNEEAYS